MTVLKLYVFVIGQSTSSFTVTIPSTDTVEDLRKAIFNEIVPVSPSLRKAHQLTLYKVELQARIVGDEDLATRAAAELSKQKTKVDASLDASKKLKSCFDDNYWKEVEDEGIVHVLVEKPPDKAQSISPTHQRRASQPLSISGEMILRTELVAELYRAVKTREMIQVRGTPASGKTTLLHLLHRHMKEVESESAYRIDLWSELPGTDYASKLSSIIPNFSEVEHNSGVEQNVTYLLFDEAQETYDDIGLWNTFFKNRHISNKFRVVLFCSYGSPSSRALNYARLTPDRFNDDQRFLLWPTEHIHMGLLLLRSEIDQMADRKKLILAPAVKDAIFEWTGGHIGAVAYFLRRIRTMHTADQRNHVEYQLEQFRKDFHPKDTSFHFAKDSGGRGLPTVEELRTNASLRRMFRRLLARGEIILRDGNDPDNVEIVRSHENGWIYSSLTADGYDTYALPSPLFSCYLSWILDPPTDMPDFKDVLDFVKQVLTYFKPSQIFNPIRRAGYPPARRAPEAQYQAEFYRAAHDLTRGGILLSPEFGSARGAKVVGRIDFLVAKKLWGVELTRDGDKLKEHADRFGDAGAYGAWLKSNEMTDYVLIDCRTSVPSVPHRGIKNLYHVVFSEHPDKVRLYDNALQKLYEDDLLENQS